MAKSRPLRLKPIGGDAEPGPLDIAPGDLPDKDLELILRRGGQEHVDLLNDNELRRAYMLGVQRKQAYEGAASEHRMRSAQRLDRLRREEMPVNNPIEMATSQTPGGPGSIFDLPPASASSVPPPLPPVSEGRSSGVQAFLQGLTPENLTAAGQQANPLSLLEGASAISEGILSGEIPEHVADRYAEMFGMEMRPGAMDEILQFPYGPIWGPEDAEPLFQKIGGSQEADRQFKPPLTIQIPGVALPVINPEWVAFRREKINSTGRWIAMALHPQMGKDKRALVRGVVGEFAKYMATSFADFIVDPRKQVKEKPDEAIDNLLMATGAVKSVFRFAGRAPEVYKGHRAFMMAMSDLTGGSPIALATTYQARDSTENALKILKRAEVGHKVEIENLEKNFAAATKKVEEGVDPLDLMAESALRSPDPSTSAGVIRAAQNLQRTLLDQREALSAIKHGDQFDNSMLKRAAEIQDAIMDRGGPLDDLAEQLRQFGVDASTQHRIAFGRYTGAVGGAVRAPEMPTVVGIVGAERAQAAAKALMDVPGADAGARARVGLAEGSLITTELPPTQASATSPAPRVKGGDTPPMQVTDTRRVNELGEYIPDPPVQLTQEQSALTKALILAGEAEHHANTGNRILQEKALADLRALGWGPSAAAVGVVAAHHLGLEDDDAMLAALSGPAVLAVIKSRAGAAGVRAGIARMTSQGAAKIWAQKGKTKSAWVKAMRANKEYEEVYRIFDAESPGWEDDLYEKSQKVLRRTIGDQAQSLQSFNRMMETLADNRAGEGRKWYRSSRDEMIRLLGTENAELLFRLISATTSDQAPAGNLTQAINALVRIQAAGGVERLRKMNITSVDDPRWPVRSPAWIRANIANPVKKLSRDKIKSKSIYNKKTGKLKHPDAVATNARGYLVDADGEEIVVEKLLEVNAGGAWIDQSEEILKIVNGKHKYENILQGPNVDSQNLALPELGKFKKAEFFKALWYDDVDAVVLDQVFAGWVKKGDKSFTDAGYRFWNAAFKDAVKVFNERGLYKKFQKEPLTARDAQAMFWTHVKKQAGTYSDVESKAFEQILLDNLPGADAHHWVTSPKGRDRALKSQARKIWNRAKKRGGATYSPHADMDWLGKPAVAVNVHPGETITIPARDFKPKAVQEFMDRNSVLFMDKRVSVGVHQLENGDWEVSPVLTVVKDEALKKDPRFKKSGEPSESKGAQKAWEAVVEAAVGGEPPPGYGEKRWKAEARKLAHWFGQGTVYDLQRGSNVTLAVSRKLDDQELILLNERFGPPGQRASVGKLNRWILQADEAAKLAKQKGAANMELITTLGQSALGAGIGTAIGAEIGSDEGGNYGIGGMLLGGVLGYGVSRFFFDPAVRNALFNFASVGTADRAGKSPRVVAAGRKVRRKVEDVLSRADLDAPIEFGDPDLEKVFTAVLEPLLPEVIEAGVGRKLGPIGGGAAAAALTGAVMTHDAEAETTGPLGVAAGMGVAGMFGAGAGKQIFSRLFKYSWRPREAYRRMFTEAAGLSEEAREMYRNHRYRLNGRLQEIDDLVQELDKLGPEIGAEIDGFLRGERALASLPINAQNPAVRWRQIVDGLSVDLVDLGIATGQARDTIEGNLGVYVPRLFMAYELADANQRLQRLKTISDAFNIPISRMTDKNYLKHKNVDLPEDVLEMLGEIKDNPAYLLHKRGVITAVDVEKARFFNEIASSDNAIPEHLFGRTITEEEALEFAEQFGIRAPETSDELNDVAMRLRELELDGVEEPTTFWRDGYKRAKWQGREYVKLSSDERFGVLAGRYVDKELAFTADAMTQGPEHMGTAFYKAALGSWKTGKVAWNPATLMRNVWSNFILADLAGVSPAEVFRIGARKSYFNQDEWYQEARRAGLFGGEYLKTEVGELLGVPGDTSRHAFQQAADGLTSVAGKFNPLKGAERFHNASEQFFKLAVFKHARQRLNLDVTQAADYARKYIFDYGDVPEWIKIGRQSMFGAPFITFSYKAMPRVFEGMLAAGDPKKAWRFWKYPLIMGAVSEEAARNLGYVHEDNRGPLATFARVVAGGLGFGDPFKFREKMPSYVGANQVLLRWKDVFDRPQALDMTWISPWGDIGEWGKGNLGRNLGRMGIPFPRFLEPSNPFLHFGAAALTGRDPFTGFELYKAGAGFEDRAPGAGKQLFNTAHHNTLRYAMRVWLPQISPPAGFAQEKLRRAFSSDVAADPWVPDKYMATASEIFGVKVRPFDPLMTHASKARRIKRKIDSIRNFEIRDLARRGAPPEAYQLKRAQMMGLSEELQSMGAAPPANQTLIDAMAEKYRRSAADILSSMEEEVSTDREPGKPRTATTRPGRAREE